MKTKYFALAFVALVACTKPQSNDLVGKKAELAELKSQQTEIAGKIKTLESEISKLNPNKEVSVKVKNVVTAPLQSQTFKHFIEVQGTVEAKNDVKVSARSQGTITRVYVTEGSAVKQGQLLAEQDNSVLKESIEALNTQLSLATTLYEKQKNLWAQQIGTEIQYLQAKANKEAIERQIATQQSQVSLSKIIAPISGVVDEVTMKVGEMPMPGMSYIRVVNAGSLKIVAKVADTYLSSVRMGDNLLVRFPDLNQEINARVSFISKIVNPLSRTFTIEANIPNVGGMTKPNQLAVVNINDQTKVNALVIKQNLVQSTEQGDLVYVAVSEGNKKVAKARKVKTGMNYNGDIVILEGLQAGDLIITQGYQELVDGQVISF
jgi:membrane fusion protein, multidrug efflux system